MIIYKTTNLINGKIYIGQDLYNNPAYIGSGVLLKKAIKKYGKENFRKDILEYCNSREHLNEREIYWIDIFNSRDLKIGYNISLGGRFIFSSCEHSEVSKQKMSKSRKGHTVSDETKKKISESNTGKKRSTETCRKITKSKLGKVPWNKGLTKFSHNSLKTQGEKISNNKERAKKISNAKLGKPFPNKNNKTK
jgi:group I intron endonuclease